MIYVTSGSLVQYCPQKKMINFAMFSRDTSDYSDLTVAVRSKNSTSNNSSSSRGLFTYDVSQNRGW